MDTAAIAARYSAAGAIENGMSVTRVKGSAFKSVLHASEALRGKDFVERVRSEIPGEAGDAVRFGGIISSGWYPVAWYVSVYGTIVQLAGEPDFARAVGRMSTRHDAGTVLRVFFRVLSVTFLLEQGARAFKMFFEGCDLEIKATGNGTVSMRWSNCHGFDRNLWLDQLGTVEELFALSGGKSLDMRVSAGGRDGDAEMLVAAIWS